MAESPHYFIGIPINEDRKKEILRCQQTLKQSLGENYRIWTHPEDFHITLKFLGGVDDDRIPVLKKELRNGDYPHPFQLPVGGIGTFGKPKKPRVLWTGVETTNALEKLKVTVEQVCQQAGFEQDTQPYRPHVTLAKKWKGEKLSKDKLSQLTENFQVNIEMEVFSFSLFRIYPSKNPKYKEVLKIKLE